LSDAGLGAALFRPDELFLAAGFAARLAAGFLAVFFFAAFFFEGRAVFVFLVAAFFRVAIGVLPYCRNRKHDPDACTMSLKKLYQKYVK
jgi:hypothetical protein